MYYIVDRSALWDMIYAEVSHVADEAYGENGLSLYDQIIVTSKDRDNINRYIDDAVSQFVRREFDITKYSPLITYAQRRNSNGQPIYYGADPSIYPTGGYTTTNVTQWPVMTDEIESITVRMLFHVPDFDASMALIDDTTEVLTGGALKDELDKYITLFVCTSLFQQRRPSVAPDYSARTQSAMDKAVTLLKYRKHPVTLW